VSEARSESRTGERPGAFYILLLAHPVGLLLSEHY
jgi:hypothetical protein